MIIFTILIIYNVSQKYRENKMTIALMNIYKWLQVQYNIHVLYNTENKKNSPC